MGRYTYNATKVESALVEMNNALAELEDINVQIQRGIDTLKSATGYNLIDANGYSGLLKYQELAEAVIEEDIKTIKKKAAAIEEYTAPGIKTAVKRIFSTLGMSIAKFSEGVATSVEEVGDGVVSIIGFTGGIFSSKFKESCAEYVKKDRVGDRFNKWYEEGWLKSVNDYSYMSHKSTGANLFKGVGVAVGYVAMAAVGGEFLGATATAANVTVAGLGGTGSGTQTGLQSGMSFDQAFGHGVKRGAINASLAYVVGKSSEKRAIKNSENSDVIMSSGLKNGKPTKVQTYNDKLSQLGRRAGYSARNSRVGKAIFNTADDITKNVKNVTSSIGKTPIGKFTVNTASGIKKGITDVGKQVLKYKPISLVTTAAGTVGKIAMSHPTATLTVAQAANVVAQTNNQMAKEQFRKTSEVVDRELNNNHLDPVPVPVPEPEVFTDNSNNNNNNNDNNNANKNNYNYNGNNNNYNANNDGNGNNNNYNANNDGNGNNNLNDNNSNNNASDNNNNANKNDNNSSNNNYNDNNKKPENNTGTNNSNNNVKPDKNNGANDTFINVGGHNSSYPQGGSYNIDGNQQDNGLGIDIDTIEDSLADNVENTADSFADLITGNNYTNIPTASTPISTTLNSGEKNSTIPIIAGLGAAAVAGIGTKSYLDKKENKEETEDENYDEVIADEWSGEDTFDVEYEETENNDYLSPTDEYAYQEEPQESYQAVNSSELASMQ